MSVRQGWQPTDCHAHSTYSDGALNIAEVVARGAAHGVRPSVTDHISRAAPTSLSSLAAIDAYLDDLEQFDVLCGGEFCWHDALWREVPANVVRRFTHRIGSLHSVRLVDGTLCSAFAPALPPGLTSSAYIEAHVSSLETLAREMPVDILAHPTLVSPCLRELEPTELWSEAHEERAVGALRDAGIAFEISAKYRPHERFVRRAAGAGVRISLGSDGHSWEQVADISTALDLARLVGVPDDALYDPLCHGSRTGHYG